jgi:hypothetical protein
MEMLQERLELQFKAVGDASRNLILPHNAPDPDAIASARRCICGSWRWLHSVSGCLSGDYRRGNTVALRLGVGARHTAAAWVTACTAATAIVVSPTDGNVRAFAGGQMALQLDPGVPICPTAMDE